MNTAQKRRRICNSLYHQKWFRVLLIIVGVDMFMLGFSFAIGIDLISIVPELGVVLRAVFGLMYILVSLFVIHYSIAYEKIQKESHFVCHHCSHDEEEHQ